MGTKLRKFGNAEGIKWCNIISRTNSIQNRYVNDMLKMLREKIPGLVKKCPLHGPLEIIDLPPSNGKLLTMFPGGLYSVKFNLFGNDGEANNVKVNFSMTFEVK